MHFWKVLVPTLTLASSLIGCGGEEIEPDVQRIATVESQIQGGYVDDLDTHAVGIVRLGNYGYGACSGTLIAPNVVLTAQHCVANSGSDGYVICGQTKFSPPYPANELYVTTRTSFTQNAGDYHRVKEIHVAPAANAPEFCGNDVALIILENVINPAEATPAVPRVDEPLVAGEEYYAVGHGARSDGGGNNSGTRYRRDQLFAQCVGGACGIQSSVAETEWRGDTGICSGDSGGGAYDLYNRVHGVASRGSQGCANPVYGGTYGWGQWIKDTTLYASGLAGIEAPPWASGYPTDPAYHGPVGGECSLPAQCPSGACLNGYCTRQCNDLAPCPDGYQCGADLWCEEAPEIVAPIEEIEDEVVNSCAVAAPGQDPTKPIPWELAAFALGAAMMLRRRR